MLTAHRIRLSLLATVALVALRMGAGWHFFKEGSKKFHDPEFTSAGLFDSATGPFAEFYRGLVPDRMGRTRLDLNAAEKRWDRFTEKAIEHYNFNEQQQAAVRRALGHQKEALGQYFTERGEDLEQYFRELERLERMRKEDATSTVEFGRSRLKQLEAQLKSQRSQWLADLRTLANHYEEVLYNLATPQQRAAGKLGIDDPNAMWIDSLVKYVITGVGVCLLLGLLTRVAALVGIGFLLTVMGTQPPWVEDASLTFFYYQMVEVLALFVLFAFAAGRYAGLDYVLAGWFSREPAASSPGEK